MEGVEGGLRAVLMNRTLRLAVDVFRYNYSNLQIDFFGFSDVGENVLMQPDGKIVVGGLARNNVDGYGLARILP